MKKILIITWLVSIALTVGLYLYVFSSSEYGHLFAVNLGVAIVAVSILVYGIGGFTSQEKTEVTNVSRSILLMLYAIVLFTWTTASSLIWDEDPFLKIWIGNGVLTILLAVLYGTTTAGSLFIEEHEAVVESVKSSKKSTVLSMSDWYNDLVDLIGNEEEDWKDALIRNAKTAKDIVETIPARQLANQTSFCSSLEGKTSQILTLASSLSGTDNKEEVMSKLSEEIASLKKYVEREKRIF